MTAHYAMGRLLASRAQAEAGLREFQSGVALSEALYKIEPDNTEWLQANVDGLFHLADLQVALGRTEEAARTTRGGCDIVGRLVQRDQTVTNWRARLQVICLNLRAKLASGSGNGAQAVALAQQSLAVAQASPKPRERSVLSMLARSVGSSALHAVGRSNEATDWARKGVAVAPERSLLSPRELVELSSLEQRAGNTAAARRIATRLDSIGYRHPNYSRRNGIQRT